MPRAVQQPVREADLRRWRLVESFQEALEAAVDARGGLDGGTWTDERRTLQLGGYLGLYLFGLFNPVVTTMRGLVKASRLGRVQEEVCGTPVSLGSFSEAQAVVEPDLLAAVFAGLQAQAGPRDAQFSRGEVVIDSTVWPVLPRMAWAFWRRQGPAQNAVRLHVEFDLARRRPARAELTPAKACEQAWWRRCVRLGVHGDGPRARIVQVLGEEETLLLATDQADPELTPELLAQLYRYRWQIELFFRWLKCILGCRHWLAESPRGVALQVYLALIAAQLLLLHTGQRPGKRQMELIQFYLLGWASLDELVSGLGPDAKKH